MKLEGHIGEIDLIEQLLQLARDRFTGAIRFEHDGVIKIVYFKEGSVLSASTNDRADSVDEILLRSGKVTRDHVKQALARRKENESLGDALLTLGFVTRKELTWARRVQLVGVVRSVHEWGDGSFTIVHDYLPRREEGTSFVLPQIILELLVTSKEREKIERAMDGGSVVLARTASFSTDYPTLGLNDDADRIVSMIDGFRSAQEIASGASVDIFTAYKLLHALEVLGLAVRDKPHASLELSLDAPASDIEPGSEETMELGMEIPPIDDEPDAVETVAERIATPPVELPRVTFDAPGTIPTFDDTSSFDFDGDDRQQSVDDDEQPTMPSAPAAVVKSGNRARTFAVLIVLAVVLGGAGFVGFRAWSERSANAADATIADAPPVAAAALPADIVAATPSSAPEVTVEPAATAGAIGVQGAVDPASAASVDPTPASTTTAAAPRPEEKPAQSRAEAARPIEVKNPADTMRKRYEAMAAEFASTAASTNFTIQFELVCQTDSITKALREGGSDVWFVPVDYRGASCFRVFWRRYATRKEAEGGIATIPAALGGSRPAVIEVNKVIR